MADSPSGPDRPRERLGVGRLVFGIALFVVLGIPLSAIVWQALNEIIAGFVRLRHLYIGLPAFILLLVLWAVLGRTVQRWDATRHPVHDPRRVP